MKRGVCRAVRPSQLGGRCQIQALKKSGMLLQAIGRRFRSLNADSVHRPAVRWRWRGGWGAS